MPSVNQGLSVIGFSLDPNFNISNLVVCSGHVFDESDPLLNQSPYVRGSPVFTGELIAEEKISEKLVPERGEGKREERVRRVILARTQQRRVIWHVRSPLHKQYLVRTPSTYAPTKDLVLQMSVEMKKI